MVKASFRQANILSGAPKFRFARAGHVKHLIPATPIAQQWAVEHHNVTLFDALAFHRFNFDGLPSEHRWGDFHCTIDNRGPGGVAPIREMISDVCIHKLTTLDLSAIRLTFLGDRSIAISVPSSFFKQGDGSPALANYYNAFENHLLAWKYEFGFNQLSISHVGLMAAENSRLPDGRFAIPFEWRDIETNSGLIPDSFARTPRTLPTIKCDGIIDNNLASELFAEALLKRNEKQAAANSVKRRNRAGWISIVPLSKKTNAAMERSDAGMRCALRLLEWLWSSRIREFRQHNAVDAVVGTFKLKADAGGNGGVAEALRILTEHNYIRACPFPPFEYACRRITPWFVVNPSLFQGRTKPLELL